MTGIEFAKLADEIEANSHAYDKAYSDFCSGKTGTYDAAQAKIQNTLWNNRWAIVEALRMIRARDTLQPVTVDGVFMQMPVCPPGEPMLLGDGGPNPRFDWEWWKTHRGTPSAVTVGKSADTPSPSTSHADSKPIEKTEGGA